MKNTKITELEYRDFSLDVHQKIGEERTPLVGQMELTLRCNLKCTHCYVAEDHSRHELSYSEITDILDQIHREGCLWLSFTGGDPFMRRDFLEIYRHAKRKGFLITLLTNGTLITKEIADYLTEEPPFSIDLTLNGITQDTYEKISQVPGSFKSAMEAIVLIMDKKLPLKIKTKVTRLNYHELHAIKEFVASLGLECKTNALLRPRLDGSLEPCSFRLSPDQLIDFDTLYQKECQESDSKQKYLSPPDNVIRCAAGINSFHISPYGELIFCTFLRKPNFDLRKGSFKQGFYSLYPKIRSAKYKTNSKCRDCRIFHLCAQCSASAVLENGDPEAPIAYFCQLAHQRAGMKECAAAR